MKFVSQHRNYRTVIVPADYEWHGNNKKLVRGLDAFFADGEFDSEAEARRRNWSPETQRQVEDALMQHEDFGRNGGFWLVNDEPALVADVQARQADLIDPGAKGMCAVVFQTPDGAVRCQNRAKRDSRYCAAHQNVTEKVAAEVSDG